MDLHVLQGDNLPRHGLHHGLQGKAFCCGVLSTSSPSFFTDLGVCRVVSLTSSHSFLYTAVLLQFFSSSQICYHRGAATIADWLGLGHRWVPLRAGWHWLYQTWGKLLAASHRSHPCSSATTKTLPHKPISTCHSLHSKGQRECIEWM